MSTIEKATSELHRMFIALNDKYFAGTLPTPAITIQTQGKRAAYGWCSTIPFWDGANGITRYEINMSAESLDRDVNEVARTLLHEMVHLHNAAVMSVQDCSRAGNYHNMKFKITTERDNMFSRSYEKPDKKHGWSQCDLTEETIAFMETITIDQECFSIHRNVPEVAKKKSNSVKLVCPQCETSVRASKKGIYIICKPCGVEMVDPDEPFDDDYFPDDEADEDES